MLDVFANAETEATHYQTAYGGAHLEFRLDKPPSV